MVVSSQSESEPEPFPFIVDVLVGMLLLLEVLDFDTFLNIVCLPEEVLDSSLEEYSVSESEPFARRIFLSFLPNLERLYTNGYFSFGDMTFVRINDTI